MLSIVSNKYYRILIEAPPKRKRETKNTTISGGDNTTGITQMCKYNEIYLTYMLLIRPIVRLSLRVATRKKFQRPSKYLNGKRLLPF